MLGELTEDFSFLQTFVVYWALGLGRLGWSWDSVFGPRDSGSCADITAASSQIPKDVSVAKVSNVI